MGDLIEMILTKLLELVDRIGNTKINRETVNTILLIFFGIVILCLQLIITYNIHGGA